ncbi:MAG: AAA family ATPase [Saprospiraceae bacterium]|nr:AAA family ATPase [Saprospiraceae bacterium]
MKNIYVAATGQHVGKTTSTLGLVVNLAEKGIKTGYCKPVGQQSVNIDGASADKDAVLFSDFLHFSMNPDLHSPVVLGPGITRRYINDESQFDFRDKILNAANQLEAFYDLVVYEGTGHPGVGTVVDLSNAQVARMLDCGVVMIVEGGIGNTIDRLHMSLALFREEKVPILGVIVNKVFEEKKEEIEYYLRQKFDRMDIPLLGVLPYDKSLSFPIMETVNQAVDGKVVLNEDRLGNRVEDIIAGSLLDIDEFSSFNNVLLVVSYGRIDEAISKIEDICTMKGLTESPLSGVIVTGDGRHERWYERADFSKPYFVENEIPVITTPFDTYGSVVKVSRIEVKINTKTPWKIKRAVELIREHVDMERLVGQLVW